MTNTSGISDAIPVIRQPSPNFDSRNDQMIKMLVLHYTGMETTEAALERLCCPKAAVSTHYLIDLDGTIFKLVDEDQRAWHAGVAYWRGITDVNAASIGIELVNKGHEFGYHPFPKVQIAALTLLARDILNRYKIEGYNVVGHSDIAPLRKEDPGELFDWRYLAEAGIGLFPEPSSMKRQIQSITADTDQETIALFQRDLLGFGYGIKETGCWDELTQATLLAFQRHFNPGYLNDQRASVRDRTILNILLESSPLHTAVNKLP